VEELQRNRPANGGAPLEYLEVYDDYGCLLCSEALIIFGIHEYIIIFIKFRYFMGMSRVLLI
jgi:hypothetical protein